MNILKAGEGAVHLLAAPGRVWTDVAARFCRSEKSVTEIADSPYSAELVRNLVRSGHLATTEFDFYVFGVEGYSRVCEVQLVRKRMASYIIKSGRAELGAKRAFNVVMPDNVLKHHASIPGIGQVTGDMLLYMMEEFYGSAIAAGIPDEDARYIKPQATEFRAIIGMNAHALLDWFGIRMCRKAQHEIRDMAYKMYSHCVKQQPDLFSMAGPRCKSLGYCPEDTQHPGCYASGKLSRKEAMDALAVAGAAKQSGGF